jgi:hypothetical protein
LLISTCQSNNIHPNKSLDAAKIKYDSIRHYLALLNQFQNPTNDPRKFPTSFEILRQVSLSFLLENVPNSLICTLQHKSELCTFIKKNLGIVSGNLFQWKQAFITCTEDCDVEDLIELMDNLYLQFEKLDLGDLCKRRNTKIERNDRTLFQLT